MNTGLGLGKSPSKGWIAFHDFIKRSPNANVGGIIARGTPHLTQGEISGYDAPHPNQISKVRAYPFGITLDHHLTLGTHPISGQHPSFPTNCSP